MTSYTVAHLAPGRAAAGGKVGLGLLELLLQLRQRKQFFRRGVFLTCRQVIEEVSRDLKSARRERINLLLGALAKMLCISHESPRIHDSRANALAHDWPLWRNSR